MHCYGRREDKRSARAACVCVCMWLIFTHHKPVPQRKPTSKDCNKNHYKCLVDTRRSLSMKRSFLGHVTGTRFAHSVLQYQNPYNIKALSLYSYTTLMVQNISWNPTEQYSLPFLYLMLLQRSITDPGYKTRSASKILLACHSGTFLACDVGSKRMCKDA